MPYLLLDWTVVERSLRANAVRSDRRYTDLLKLRRIDMNAVVRSPSRSLRHKTTMYLPDDTGRVSTNSTEQTQSTRKNQSAPPFPLSLFLLNSCIPLSRALAVVSGVGEPDVGVSPIHRKQNVVNIPSCRRRGRISSKSGKSVHFASVEEFKVDLKWIGLSSTLGR